MAKKKDECKLDRLLSRWNFSQGLSVARRELFYVPFMMSYKDVCLLSLHLRFALVLLESSNNQSDSRASYGASHMRYFMNACELMSNYRQCLSEFV